MSAKTTPTILVIDDDAMNREVMEAFLASENYGVLLANNGRRGLETAHTNQPDLIILDLKMPDMDGFTVCEQLKSSPDTHHIPVLIVTGFDSPKDQANIMAAGADGFLPRPFKGMDLLDTVSVLLSASTS